MRAALTKSLAPPAARHVSVEKAVQTAWWELRRLADRAQPAVRRAFMAAVADVRSVTTLARLEEMVRTGDLAGLQRVLAGEPLEAALRARLAPAVVRLAQDAGQKAVGALPASLRGVARFDLLNPKTVDFLRSYSFGLIRQIGATTREGIRRVVTDAFERGGHPRVQARQIRSMVGLTARQAAAVSGYRAQLLAQGVKQAVADRRAQRYADRLVRRRALNIARTETIRAANVGQQALWDQMADEGLIERDRARKVWIVTPDDRLAVAAKTPIFTSVGWKPVQDVRPGDYVLTHKDRFRRVTHVIARRYDGPMVRLCVGGRARVKVAVTYGHPVLVNGGDWVDAENVRSSDLLRVLAKPCADCGELIPYGPGGTEVCRSCSARRSNATRWSKPGERERQRRRNLERWSDPAARRRMSEAIRERWRDEGYRRRMLAAEPERRRKLSRLAREGRIGFGAMTYEQRLEIVRNHVHFRRARTLSGDVPNERILADLLDAQGLEYVQQWEYRYTDPQGRERVGFADFFLPGPRVVIECTSTKSMSALLRAKRDSLLRQGYVWLQFSTRELRDGVHNVASEIRKHCCFLDMAPARVEHYTVRRQTVYDLRVEGDESFVAGGIVVHNCPICAAIPGMNPGGVPAQGGEFTTDVGPVPYPPAHPQCRCAVGLEFKDTPAPPQPPTQPAPRRKPRVRRVRPPVAPRRTTPAEQRRRAQLTPQPEEAMRGLPPVPMVPPSFDEAFEVAKDWLKKADEFARRTYNVGVVDTTEFLKVAMGGRAKTRDIYEAAKRSLDPALDRARKNAKAAARKAGTSYSDDYSYAQRIYAEKMVARAARTGYQSGLQQTLETVEEALKELERLKGTFPMAGAELVVFPFAQGVRSLGYVYRYSAAGADTRVIFLNGRLARKKSIATEGAALVRRTRRTGDAPWNAVAHEETSTAAMTLRHEFAHALDPMIQGPARKAWLYGSVQEATEIGMEFRAIIEQEARKAGMTERRWFRKDDSVRKHISQYGAKKGWSEMWPEMITMVTGPGYVKGTLPPAVEEFVMKIVRRVKARGGLGTAD